MKIRKLLFTVLTVGMVSNFWICAQAQESSTIQQGVSIGGVDVSGMTEEGAKAAVDAEVETMKTDVITVTIGSKQTQATADDFGIVWSNTDVVEDASLLGMKGNIIQRYKDKKDLEKEPHNFELEFSADKSKIQSFIENKCKEFETPRVDATIEDDEIGRAHV